MEKQLVKYECDFCGRECDKSDYIVPVYDEETAYASNLKGDKVVKFDKAKIVPQRIDVCPICEKTLAELIHLSRFVSVHEIKAEIDKTVYNALGNYSEEEYHQITMDEYLESLGESDD